MKMERMPIQVGEDYQKLLGSLAAPMQVNEMRTMKEPNYSELRKVLSQYKGGEILRLMHKFSDSLGLDPMVFDLVYEGFWDIYLFNGQISDGASGKKMLLWIPKVKLHVNETTGSEDNEKVAAEGGDEG